MEIGVILLKFVEYWVVCINKYYLMNLILPSYSKQVSERPKKRRFLK